VGRKPADAWVSAGSVGPYADASTSKLRGYEQKRHPRPVRSGEWAQHHEDPREETTGSLSRPGRIATASFEQPAWGQFPESLRAAAVDASNVEPVFFRSYLGPRLPFFAEPPSAGPHARWCGGWGRQRPRLPDFGPAAQVRGPATAELRPRPRPTVRPITLRVFAPISRAAQSPGSEHQMRQP